MLQVSRIGQVLRSNFYLSLIFLFSFSLIIVNYIWVKSDIAPPPWDQAFYLEHSQYLYHNWVKDGFIGLLKTFAHALNGNKAPLISLIPLPFYFIFGNSEMVSMFVNFFFLLLLSYFLFRLVEHISNQRVAFLSVLITQTVPLFVGLNRQFFVEYGLATFVVMFLYCLVKSDYFQNKHWNLWLGVLLGLGVLMKILFVLYIFFPVLWIIYLRSKYKKDIFKFGFIKELFEICFIGGVIASVWYIPNLKSVLGFAFSAAFGDISVHYGSTDVFNFDVIFNYWKYLMNSAFSIYYSFAFLITAVLSLLISFVYKVFGEKKTGVIRNDFRLFLALWFFCPFIIFTLGVSKDMRFVLPLIPVISVFIAAVVDFVFRRKNKIIFLLVSIAIVIYPIVALFKSSFLIESSARDFKGVYMPDPIDWKTDEVVEYIYKEMYKLDNPSVWNIVGVEHSALNANTYSYFAAKRDYPYPITFTNLGYNQENLDDVLTRFPNLKPSFVILEEGIDSSKLEAWANKANDPVKELLDARGLPYVKDKVFELTNGVKIVLYKKINDNF